MAENASIKEVKINLDKFLNKYAPEVSSFDHAPVDEGDVISDFKDQQFQLTHFNDIDTFLYSKLIEKALELSPEVKQLVDLGAGSSVPTLCALDKNGRKDLSVIAVDIDPEALKISKKNAEDMKLADIYNFHQGSMESFLSSEQIKRPQTLIVSNPPYIPAPESAEDYYFLPINGGTDGTKYLVDILKQDYSETTTLALFWGSLCNPSLIISLIEEKYEVLYNQATKTRFGAYTSKSKIKDHLYRLKDEGKVVFEKDSDEGETQIVIGTVLRPKKLN